MPEKKRKKQFDASKMAARFWAGKTPNERSRIMKARRKKGGDYYTGGGRPPEKDRCPCGEMTRARAEKRRHVCSPMPLRAA
jgi:hypothetical protein